MNKFLFIFIIFSSNALAVAELPIGNPNGSTVIQGSTAKIRGDVEIDAGKTLKIDKISDSVGTGPVELSKGATIPTGEDLNTDTVSQTGTNGVTVGGVNLKAGKITTDDSVDSGAIQNTIFIPTLTATTLGLTGNVTTSGGKFLGPNGAQGAPTFGFSGTKSGMWADGLYELSFTVQKESDSAGTYMGQYRNDNTFVGHRLVTGQYVGGTGSQGAPLYSTYSDKDTGIWFPSDGYIRVGVNNDYLLEMGRSGSGPFMYIQGTGGHGGNIVHQCQKYTDGNNGGTTASDDANCPDDKKAMGGGCVSGGQALQQSYPLDNLAGWGCSTQATATVEAFAVCCNY